VARCLIYQEAKQEFKGNRSRFFVNILGILGVFLFGSVLLQLLPNLPDIFKNNLNEWDHILVKLSLFNVSLLQEFGVSPPTTLAFISDDVVTRLSDSAPDIGNKFWAAFDTFNKAETNEEYAQVATSCRRILEKF